MKRNSTIICTMAALLMAGAALVSCTKESQPVSGTFTLSVNASKGNPAMKDLGFNNGSLNAFWKTGEKVYVRKLEDSKEFEGWLEVVNDGGTATKLKGNVIAPTGTTIEYGDRLVLRFLDANHYNSQNGTLEYIAENCDYALDTVMVSNITNNTNTATTEDAVFNNKQAIVKFTLKDKDNSDAPITANTLKVEVEGQSAINVTLSPAASELFVAIPGFSGKNVTFTANDGTYTYTGTATGVSLSNGKYYTIPVKLSSN